MREQLLACWLLSVLGMVPVFPFFVDGLQKMGLS